MLWEKGQATGPLIYDEKNQTFRMYYHGVENCVCVLESPDGIEEEHRIWQVFARQGRDREQPPWTARNTTQPVEFPETHENWTTVLSAGIIELLGDGGVNSSGFDGYAALEAIVAAHISHENGGVPVSLPLIGDDLLREFTFT